MKFYIENKTYTPQEIAETFLDSRKESSWFLDIGQFVANWIDDTKDTIVQKTSGSTGTPKEILLQKEQMRNSALMTGRYFDFQQMNKMLLCLPAHYIAGKMMIVRALVWDLDLYCVQAKSNPLTEIDEHFDFTAMIPMQISEVLKNDLSARRLEKIQAVLIGGAPVSSLLLEKIQALPIDCYASYGMTETVSHIAIRKLNGMNAKDSFYPLEEIELGMDERGCLQINAPLLNNNLLTTNDLVQFKEGKAFQILGRWDNVIISGGVKLIVEEIEKKMAPFISENFYLLGKTDEKLGEKLVLFIEGMEWNMDKKTIFFKQINEVLKRYEVAKKIVFVEKFKRTRSGKVRRILNKEY